MSEGNGDGRKVVYLGMPAYGELTIGAARGFYTASKGGLFVNRKCHCMSLLTLNMNSLWCWALNAELAGERVDYFAMQHTDIQPLPGWLDELVAELEAKQLDVLGVVAPIKGQEGTTSIAMAHPSGDSFEVLGRLTMREIFRLPETFTSEDLGHPLLLNTGLWVAKWGPWCKGIHFTVNDEIVFAENKQCYVPRVESEDWFLSRLFHQAGLRIGCTRKIELGHVGPMNFGNHQPWGNLEYDTYHLSKSALDERHVDWFPHEVEGWLTVREGTALANLADGKAVLEIGSYCGRSTICLAQKAISVDAIDPFDSRGTDQTGDTFERFAANLKKHGVAERVGVHRGTSEEVVPRLRETYDLVFIDGAHDLAAVQQDIKLALTVLKPDGLVAFHDYRLHPGEADGRWDPGVTQAVNELIAAGGKLLARHHSLAVVRPPAGILLEV